MMFIRIASDLHLEQYFGRKAGLLIETMIPAGELDAQSMLVLAGDISSQPDQLVDFLEACLKRFNGVLYIPGNHEFYRHDYFQWCEQMEQRLQPLTEHGLLFSTKDVRVTELPDARFVYGTLWGDGGFTLADAGQVGFYLNDFRLIQYGVHPDHGAPLRFKVDDMVSVFKAQRSDISAALQQKVSVPTVVVTHHLPSRRLVSKRFWPGDGSDGSNGGFVGDCENAICTLEPSMWIHGHTHDSIDTMLWRTRVIANPRGYHGEFKGVQTMNSYNDGPKYIEL